jgi:hypothetical protein
LKLARRDNSIKSVCSDIVLDASDKLTFQRRISLGHQVSDIITVVNPRRFQPENFFIDTEKSIDNVYIFAIAFPTHMETLTIFK